tara:strand:+ start:1836 stop:2021 length:186 start_codon:yes stop_codon:yes gene_type:complete
MTIQQKIRQAKNVFVWVIIYDGDGEYIEVSKSKLINVLKSNFENLDQSRFVLREDGDLYVD